ncbi:MAG: cytochrome P450 [Pirellulales bacterium]|nr:cytochrome P450 [Pirellulales bacterium]
MAALLDGLPATERKRFQVIDDHFSVGMIRSDPPDHTRLRKLINKAFVPRVVAESRSQIESLVDQLLEPWSDPLEVDLVKDFAYPLPATAICQMLGVPPEDRNLVHEWTLGINAVIVGTLPLREAAAKMQKALLELQEYFRNMIADRRQALRNDLMSLLVTAKDELEQLSESELLSTAENLFSAGHETTTSLIANGVVTLLKHPEQWQRLCENPGAPDLPMAIEEILRYESPVQRQTRVVRHNCNLAGQQRGHHFFYSL